MPGMVRIPGGTLEMGTRKEWSESRDKSGHSINAFWMDATEVTNRQFQDFVDTTGYLTVAERPVVWEEMAKQLPAGTPKPPDSLLQPGALVFRGTDQPVPLHDASQWWHWTAGANWRHPQGPGSGIEDKMDHPVVQIAWEDARAFCNWAGKRLPTEMEWEWAARGGRANERYPWGNLPPEVGTPKANFWQGLFPYQNTKKDGYETTAPVGSFPPNGYDLYDMAGNVWEWCSDGYGGGYKVIRGGSFLCNDSYCSGYRNDRRMGTSADTGLNHTGFRCVKSSE